MEMYLAKPPSFLYKATGHMYMFNNELTSPLRNTDVNFVHRKCWENCKINSHDSCYISESVLWIKLLHGWQQLTSHAMGHHH